MYGKVHFRDPFTIMTPQPVVTLYNSILQSTKYLSAYDKYTELHKLVFDYNRTWYNWDT